MLHVRRAVTNPYKGDICAMGGDLSGDTREYVKALTRVCIRYIYNKLCALGYSQFGAYRRGRTINGPYVV